MKVAYFEKELIEHLGEAARGDFRILGLSNQELRQVSKADGSMASFIAIEDEEVFDEAKCTRVMTVAEANDKITQLFVPEYRVGNEAIFNASLSAKLAQGVIDLEQLDETRSASSQYHWLQLQGVRGIGVSQPPKPFGEVL